MNHFFTQERSFLSWELQGIDGKPARLFENLPSTHAYSKEHIQDLFTGGLVVANSQSSGRGRHDRIWQSPIGKNLYFNITFPLQGLVPHQYAQMMQVSAITIAEFVRELGVDASVKWPNDILCHKQKFCGMISDLLRMEQGNFLTIGTGINVNTEAEDLANLGRPATSLKIVLQKQLNREALLREIVKRLGRSLQEVKEKGLAPWISEWREMDQFIGHKARMVEGDTVVEGTILDINDDGSLLFQTEYGNTISRYTGDLEI